MLMNIINKNKDNNGALMQILHDVQDSFGYIPYEAQKVIAEELNVPLSEVYGVITFYSRFTLNPVGKYKVGVCLGTACYVKGSDKVLERIENILKIKAGETSADGLYSIDATRCVGACGLAPVMTINEDVYGKLVPEDVDKILAKYK
jgi:NADH-quinone oxidoreductase E subunit